MPTRNVVVTDQQSSFIDALVTSGRYQNASEAFRAGLKLLERDETEWDEVRARVLESFEQIRRGEYAEGTGEEVMRRAFATARARTGI